MWRSKTMTICLQINPLLSNMFCLDDLDSRAYVQWVVWFLHSASFHVGNSRLCLFILIYFIFFVFACHFGSLCGWGWMDLGTEMTLPRWEREERKKNKIPAFYPINQFAAVRSKRKTIWVASGILNHRELRKLIRDLLKSRNGWDLFLGWNTWLLTRLGCTKKTEGHSVYIKVSHLHTF